MTTKYKDCVIWTLSLMTCFVIVIASTIFDIHYFCIFKTITGIPCPGCGGIRALQELIKGNIWHALYINPLSVFVLLFLAASPFWLFVDTYLNKSTFRTVLYGKWNKHVKIIVIVIIVLNWIWNVYKEL